MHHRTAPHKRSAAIGDLWMCSRSRRWVDTVLALLYQTTAEEGSWRHLHRTRQLVAVGMCITGMYCTRQLVVVGICITAMYCTLLTAHGAHTIPQSLTIMSSTTVIYHLIYHSYLPSHPPQLSTISSTLILPSSATYSPYAAPRHAKTRHQRGKGGTENRSPEIERRLVGLGASGRFWARAGQGDTVRAWGGKEAERCWLVGLCL